MFFLLASFCVPAIFATQLFFTNLHPSTNTSTIQTVNLLSKDPLLWSAPSTVLSLSSPAADVEISADEKHVYVVLSDSVHRAEIKPQISANDGLVFEEVYHAAVSVGGEEEGPDFTAIGFDHYGGRDVFFLVDRQKRHVSIHSAESGESIGALFRQNVPDLRDIIVTSSFVFYSVSTAADYGGVRRLEYINGESINFMVILRDSEDVPWGLAASETR